MGLDGVELIMAVEEEFQIEIEDEEAWELKTVIQLVDYVYFQIKKRGDSNWTKEIAEKKLIFILKGISSSTGYDIDLKTELDKFFPVKNRKRTWNELRCQLGIGQYYWKNLKRHIFLKIAIFASFFISSYIIGIILNFLIGVSAGIIILILSIILTQRFKNVLPLKTVADLFQIYYRPYKAGICKFEDVRSRIKEIVVEQLGVNPEDVTDNAQFINDLGLD